MNANDVIECYVTDVAMQLPRKQRNDVAFELRALLNEELEGKADAAGRPADAAMATEMLQAFGQPADVAARYQPAMTIIDPADGYRFLQLTLIGLAVVWGLGLVSLFQQPIHSASDFFTALGRQWVGTWVLSLWWPGVLVVSFGLAAWARRRWPRADWKPRGIEPSHGYRVGMVAALLGVALGVYVLLNPRGVLDLFFGGSVAPSAYDAFTFTDAFREGPARWILVLILLNVPMMIAAVVNGRRSSAMQRVDLELGLITCAVLTWTILGGPVFVVPESDRVFKAMLALVVVFSLMGLGLKLRQRVHPAPAPR
jgi:hypothetical protein